MNWQHYKHCGLPLNTPTEALEQKQNKKPSHVHRHVSTQLTQREAPRAT